MKLVTVGAGEMAQSLRALAILPEVNSSAHLRATRVCNSCSRGSEALIRHHAHIMPIHIKQTIWGKKRFYVGLGLQFLVQYLPIMQEAIDSLPSTILIKVANEENELISKK